MKCKFCGKEIEESSRICNYCGSLNDETSQGLHSKKPSKYVAYIVLPALLVVVIAFFLIFGKGKEEKEVAADTETALQEQEVIAEYQTVSGQDEVESNSQEIILIQEAAEQAATKKSIQETGQILETVERKKEESLAQETAKPQETEEQTKGESSHQEEIIPQETVAFEEEDSNTNETEAAREATNYSFMKDVFPGVWICNRSDLDLCCLLELKGNGDFQYWVVYCSLINDSIPGTGNVDIYIGSYTYPEDTDYISVYGMSSLAGNLMDEAETDTFSDEWEFQLNGNELSVRSVNGMDIYGLDGDSVFLPGYLGANGYTLL